PRGKYRDGARGGREETELLAHQCARCPWRILWQEMKLEQRQYSSDDQARGLAVIEQVERVRRNEVIHERDAEVARQRLDQETVERFVQPPHLVLTCSCDEQRDIARQISD